MNRLLKISFALVSATAVHATPVLIDSFTTQQSALILFGTSPASAVNTVASASSVGGNRTILIERSAGNAIDSASVTNGAGFASISSAGSLRTTLTWDGDNSDALLAGSGLGVDLTSGLTNTMFAFGLRSDSTAPVTIILYSGLGGVNSSSATVTAPGLGTGSTPFTPSYILFTSFTTLTGTGADLTNIAAIRLIVDGQSTPGLDADISFLEATAAPEPSTWLLIGGSLVGIGLRGIRRAKKA